MRVLTERQFTGWQDYYEAEPWGEERADWRQLANQMIWSKIIGGGDAEAPSPVWPYFAAGIDPAELLSAIEATDANLEPKPGGGYQWKVQRGDDNRQT